MPFVTRSFSILFAAAAMLATASAQQASGVINGVFTLPERTQETTRSVEIRLYESSSNSLVQSVNSSDGRFTFRDVPFGRYRVEAWRRAGLLGYSYVSVNTSVPVSIEVRGESRAGEVVIVEAPRSTVDPEKTSSTKIFTSSMIQELPSVSSERKIESILLNTPGVVPDEDGRLHVRGEDAQIQYVIDGIPVTANMTRVYSSLFDADLIKTVSVQTGGLNAEYGVAAAGVLAITTKSGFDLPYFANASASYGSYNTREFSAQAGGNIDGKVAGFFSVGTSEGDRYLDPISGFDPIHDHGLARHFFGKVDGLIGDVVDVDVLGGYDATTYDVPNGKEKVPPQDQVQDLKDYLIGVHLDAYLGESATLSALAYHRRATAEVTSGGLKQLQTQGDVAKAIAENERFFIGADRSNEQTGGQLELSLRGDWLDMAHNVKAGVGGEVYPLHEFFTFAVTDSAISSPYVPGGDIRYQRHDLTRGNTPMLVDTSVTGNRISGYIQDQVKTGPWTVNLGLRYDHFDLLTKESAISPRVAAAYALSPDLVLRGSYSRIVMQAPIENILVSSSQQALLLAAGEQAGTPNVVTSEKSNSFEIGASYRLNDNISFDLVGYGKLIDDFIVKVELGNSGVIFPVNLKNGMVAGGELRAELHDLSNFSASVAVGGGAALGLKPDDGTSPIAAGLILGEEGESYSHPFAGEDAFPTEHNQTLTASFTVTYHEPHGVFATLGGRFDSGLPFDLVGSDGKGLSAEASRAELKSRGYSDDVIDMLSLEPEAENPDSPDKSVAPHAVFDLLAGVDLMKLAGINARVSLGVQNILDTPYLFKFESSFSGTHFGIPRTFLARIDVGI
jgi:outer membrane receptor protein involved in Fe transport